MVKSACVSIVVPIYNQEKYLDQSIPSLLNQTYTNLNIVLVNDGSTDRSAAIIDRYAAHDNRIVVVNQANGGLVDATLAGIAHAHGEYICFLDPDDLLGPNYVSLFMQHMEPDLDFLAAGFYYDNKGTLIPYRLKEDRTFQKDELHQACNSFLCEASPDISNRFFISRWNKIYRTTLVQTITKEFAHLRGVSLGEDTNFTYLALTHANKAKTIAQPNSYFYNIGNQQSMMKSGNPVNELEKCRHAYESFLGLIRNHHTDSSQALALYYFLVDNIIKRAEHSDAKTLASVFKLLKQDAVYQQSKAIILKHVPSFLHRLLINSNNATSYRFIQWSRRTAIATVSALFAGYKNLKYWLEQCRKKGPIRAGHLLSFHHKRAKAFVDLKKKLPLLERRILPILRPYMNQSTDLSTSSIEKNVFVFWWDGFDHAPVIVQKCFASIKKNHPDYTIIPIDKNNYIAYTDIDPLIIRDFKKDKISVQTFSDILRFNLLKNNGGVWIDATIFFNHPYDLLQDIQEKSFTSLAFSTSSDFLQYAEETCSWSGFFIASRKNGLFVQVMDEIFKKYYLTYRTYTAYFFIDMALMICKKYKIDDNVLCKTLVTQKSMFTLSSLLGESYHDDICQYIEPIPQKLAWYIADIPTQNTFLSWILSQ